MGELDASLGAMEVGVLINSFLYGVNCVQMYIYYQGTAKPHWSVRCLVPIIWIVETVSTFSMWYWLYRVTVQYDGNIYVFGQDHWTLRTTAFFDGLVGGGVQGYFAYRIHVLSRKWIYTIISWIGSVCALALTATIMVVSQWAALANFETKYAWATTASLAFLLFVDLVNTLTLCWYLRVERTGSSSVDSIMNKMFLWTLETGLLTSIAGLLMLVFSLALPKTSLWICISIFYAKLYSNSFMASLNGREQLRNSRLPQASSAPGQGDEWTYPTLNTVRTEMYPDALEPPSPGRDKKRSLGFMFER